MMTQEDNYVKILFRFHSEVSFAGESGETNSPYDWKEMY